MAGTTVKWLFLDHFNDYNSWPWAHINSVTNQWKEHPSFAVCEVLFILLGIASFVHAFKTPDVTGTRHLRYIWVTTFILGTLNDYIFMVLPVVDNFWQAQAIFMLTPRMPLYIPLAYNAFMYWSLVAAARTFYHWKRDRVAEASMCGLLGCLFYAPYDLCGATFLWWTWHDSDPAISIRWLNVPAGSTAWTITFNFSVCYLLRLGADQKWGYFKRLCLASLATPMMIVILNGIMLMAADPPSLPGLRTIVVAFVVFVFMVLRGFVSKPKGRVDFIRGEPIWVTVVIAGYFLTLICTMYYFTPESQISTGVHQTIGPCNVTEFDMLGYPRSRYICAEQYPSQYFRFDCPEDRLDAIGRWKHVGPEHLEKTHLNTEQESLVSWYTVCGQPHRNWEIWMLFVCCLSTSAFSSFCWAFTLVKGMETSTKSHPRPGQFESSAPPVLQRGTPESDMPNVASNAYTDTIKGRTKKSKNESS